MTYRFDVITLFPEVIGPYLDASILGRAVRAGLVDVGLENPRDHTEDRHRTVDDEPFGGGAGMVMMAEPLARAVESVRARRDPARVVLLSPAGRVLTQEIVQEYAALGSLALVCGRYEGVDERVASHVVDEELSIGDYVLTGGELGALAVIDAVSRLLPGVLGNAAGPIEESFTNSPLLEHPQYTRPRTWREIDIPPVLLSGHHAEIARWRQAERERRTRERRPDLYRRFADGPASDEESDR